MCVAGAGLGWKGLRFVYLSEPHQGATVPLETALPSALGCPSSCTLSSHLPAAGRTVALGGPGTCMGSVAQQRLGLPWSPRADPKPLPILPALPPGASPRSADSTENPMIYFYLPRSSLCQDTDGGGSIHSRPRRRQKGRAERETERHAQIHGEGNRPVSALEPYPGPCPHILPTPPHLGLGRPNYL